MDVDRFLTAAQAAVRLGKTISTVHRYHETGRLPAATQLPGRTGAKLFDRKAVDKLAAELKAGVLHL